MSSARKYWIIRQNYGERTYQPDMKNFIRSEKFITCPWGGWGEHRQNVIDGKFNVSANDQDRKFIEEIKIGDIVLIPFAKTNKQNNGMFLVEIISEVVDDFESEFKYEFKGKTTRIQKNSGENFKPIGRKIKIIKEYDETCRGLQRNTLTEKTDKELWVLINS